MTTLKQYTFAGLIMYLNVATSHAQPFSEMSFPALEALVLTEEGNPKFDYEYGLKANLAGMHSEAIFAFERVLAVDPGNGLARLELAYALYQLRDYDLARIHFMIVRKKNPPSAVKQKIDGYLDAIERKLSANHPHWSLNLQSGIGYTDNVNQASDANSIEFYLFGIPVQAETDPGTKPQADHFNYASIDSVYSYPLGKSHRGFVQGSAYARNQQTHDDYDLTGFSLKSGWAWGKNRHMARGHLSVSRTHLGGEPYHYSYGVGAKYALSLTSNISWQTDVQYLENRFDDQPLRNNSLRLLGTSWHYLLLEKYSTAVTVSHEMGGERPQSSDYAATYTTERYYHNTSLSVSTIINKAWRATVSSGYAISDYAGTHPLFRERREDKSIDYAATLEWSGLAALHPALKGWSLTASVRKSDTTSNIGVYTYDGVQTMMGLRFVN